MNFARETFNVNESIPPGTTLTLSPSAGFEIDANTIVVNYNEKLLVFGIDYEYNNPDSIDLLFSDPDSGDVIFQVQYTETQT